MRFFDASALVKRYVRESGTSTVRRLLREPGAVASRLSEAEISSAVHRREREGALTHAQQLRALDALRADLRRLEVVELSPKVVAAVHSLLGRHPLRAADALQLASAVVLRDALGTEIELVTYGSTASRSGTGRGLSGTTTNTSKRRSVAQPRTVRGSP